jgi:hypothetical protein
MEIYRNKVDIRRLVYYYIRIFSQSVALDTPPSSFGGICAVFKTAFFLPVILNLYEKLQIHCEISKKAIINT